MPAKPAELEDETMVSVLYVLLTTIQNSQIVSGQRIIRRFLLRRSFSRLGMCVNTCGSVRVDMYKHFVSLYSSRLCDTTIHTARTNPSAFSKTEFE